MLCFQAEAGLLGPGCVHSAGSCGRVLRGRGEPGGDRSPRGTPAIRCPSHSETVRWARPGSICRSTRALQAPGAPAVTAREGELDPPVGQPASRWKPGVWDHVHVCGICVSVCEIQARGSAPIPQSSSPPPCSMGAGPAVLGRRPRCLGSPFSTGSSRPTLPPSLPRSTPIPCEPWRNVAPSVTLGDAPAPVRGSGGHPFRAWGRGGGRLPLGAVTVVGGHPAPSHFSLSLA